MAWAETNNAPQYASMRRPATVVANANSRADAVLAVIQPELDRLAEVRRFCELSRDSMRVPVAEMAQDILRYLDTGSWTEPKAEPPCGYCGCTTPANECTTCNHDEE